MLLRVRIQAYTAPPDVRKQELALEKVLADKKEAIAHQDYGNLPPACATRNAA